MDERELNELLWRSCYLGMRLALQSLNTPDPFEKLKECVRFLGEIARNEMTLHQPQYNLAGLDPQTKRLVIGIGNEGIIADRDLAPLVVAGLDRAAIVAEGSSEVLPLRADRPPLRVDEGGAVRVGNSRVSLDLIVEQYENGMTPEDMVRAYDTLVLADVHAVIAYYLRHGDEVRAYLKRREEEAEALRAKIEAEHPRVSRAELLARRSAREKANAPTGQ
jgi:uncharacterized protein (DUF433 family)